MGIAPRRDPQQSRGTTKAGDCVPGEAPGRIESL